MMKEKRKDWKRLFRAMCLSVLGMSLLLTLLPVQSKAAETEKKVVRVGYYQNKGFQDYDEETGIYSGYSYEFLRALQQYTNWEYKFVPCSFKDGLTMLENGELDLMNNVSRTPEREETMGFSNLASGENVAYLAMKAGDTRVAMDDLKAMESIKIGLDKNSIYSERLLNYFDENGVNADIVWYDSHEECMDAFDEGEVDAYIITSSTKTDEHIILSFSPDAYYIATTKGNDELVREIDSAITALRANDPYFEIHLKEKYYGKSTENYTVFTESEKQYIAENPVINVLYQPDWYPMCYSDENGEFAGAIRGVYDLLEERTGLKFNYISVDRAYESDTITSDFEAQIMADQPSDFSGADEYDVKLTKSFVTPPLMEVANHILKPGDTIALVDGDYLSKVCQNIYGEEYEYMFCDSVKDCLEAVRKEKADGTVLISYESEYYRQQRKYSSLTYTIIDEGSYGLSIAVSNEEDPRLYSIIQKGLNSISKGEISNVFNNTLLSLQKEDFLDTIYRNPLPAFLILTILITMVVGIGLGHHFIKRLKLQNEIINEKNDALLRANQSTTNFFSRMSHDMRTPMNGILGMARLSKGENDPEILKQNIGKIEDSGEYLLGLINDTLDFQRIESGNLQLKEEIVNCQDILQNVMDMVKGAVENKHINLKVINRNTVMDCYIRVDPVRMKQIFLNLLSNAVKFTPEGGTIQVEYECMKREGMISRDRFMIRDTGIGMSKEFIEEKMFKPFSQEQNEVTGQYAGSGLGLSIVKSLVELMGGSITVESELGEGTTFTLYLDLERVGEDEAIKAATEKRKQKKQTARNLQDKKVLLAEDHPLNAEIAKKLLEKAGCIVTWVEDGKQCLDTFESAEAGQFDVILMDIRMPVMNGLEAAAAIRNIDRDDAKNIPIIAMTANAYEEDIKKSLDAGMDAHLAKPVDPAVLYDVISKVLGIL